MSQTTEPSNITDYPHFASKEIDPYINSLYDNVDCRSTIQMYFSSSDEEVCPLAVAATL